MRFPRLLLLGFQFGCFINSQIPPCRFQWVWILVPWLSQQPQSERCKKKDLASGVSRVICSAGSSFLCRRIFIKSSWNRSGRGGISLCCGIKNLSKQGLIRTGALVNLFLKKCCISVSIRWLISNSGNPYSLEHPLKFVCSAVVVKAVEPKKSSRTISWL